MEPATEAYNYPVQKETPNQPIGQQTYQQQQQINQGQGVPLGYPVNQQYNPIQQPYISIKQVNLDGPVIIQPVIVLKAFKYKYNQIIQQIIQKIIIQQIRRVNVDECSYPADIICSQCGKPGQTFIKYRSGCHTWLACWLLFLFFLPLFFLPFCFEECQDKIHYCRNCGKKVGKKKYKICG
ncbi:unnamed protein product [Paramecium sonneborni]|uniref:LITAF domain-containing protein n=1 Tax=Paramecium sonneborni TaxID=65129 RepID=A0A8S1MAX5_9CILI|nr:unnamed protein product [Paramecium sonneborni]